MDDDTELHDDLTERDTDGRYVPTPEEIAAECRRIREEWNADRLRTKRAGADGLPFVSGKSLD